MRDGERKRKKIYRKWENVILTPVGIFALLLPKLVGGVAQSVAGLTREPEVLGSIPGPATYFRFSYR